MFPFALAIPALALLIPIIALLVNHQQKMAQIIHVQGGNPGTRGEIEALRQEVQQLRYQMNQQNLALERIQSALGSNVGQDSGQGRMG